MKRIYLIIVFLTNASINTRPSIAPKENLITFLQDNQLLSNKLKLHLGCGQAHIDSYINIDFPPSDHTVQNISGADVYGDITQLILPANSVLEIRSHHVFEHFNRQKALALLAIWHHSLAENGRLIIETPDFEQSITLIQSNQYSYAQKQVVLRHIFGSHEAFWATHYDGWYEEKFRHILSSIGFQIVSVEKSSYLLTRNITVIAIKNTAIATNNLQQSAYVLLKEHMVNNAPDEKKMWQLWCNEFDASFLPYTCS